MVAAEEDSDNKSSRPDTGRDDFLYQNVRPVKLLERATMKSVSLK